ncbi:MAG: hypothetical protein GF364_15015 [Candidatus Lokiarchaeota archaeon]|nr:hypothetical protein [Candidatus Lokiarchaeota archaeon]
MLEDYMVEGDWAGSFANVYNAFLEWFTSLDSSGQLISGILIILGLILVGYMVYGILWLAFQIMKFSIIATIILHYMGYVLVKLLVVFFINYSEVNNQWENSTENIKWFWNQMYPSDKVQSQKQKITKKTGLAKQQLKANAESSATEKLNTRVKPKVFYVGDNVSNMFCTHCGTRFTDRMIEMMRNNMVCFCEKCGQMFVTPHEQNMSLFS